MTVKNGVVTTDAFFITLTYNGVENTMWYDIKQTLEFHEALNELVKEGLVSQQDADDYAFIEYHVIDGDLKELEP